MQDGIRSTKWFSSGSSSGWREGSKSEQEGREPSRLVVLWSQLGCRLRVAYNPDSAQQWSRPCPDLEEASLKYPQNPHPRRDIRALSPGIPCHMTSPNCFPHSLECLIKGLHRVLGQGNNFIPHLSLPLFTEDSGFRKAFPVATQRRKSKDLVQAWGSPCTHWSNSFDLAGRGQAAAGIDALDLTTSHPWGNGHSKAMPFKEIFPCLFLFFWLLWVGAKSNFQKSLKLIQHRQSSTHPHRQKQHLQPDLPWPYASPQCHHLPPPHNPIHKKYPCDATRSIFQVYFLLVVYRLYTAHASCSVLLHFLGGRDRS